MDPEGSSREFRDGEQHGHDRAEQGNGAYGPPHHHPSLFVQSVQSVVELGGLLINSLVELMALLVEPLIEAFLHVNEAIRKFFEPLVDFFEPRVDVFELLVDVLELPIHLFEPLVNFFEPPVDFFEPLINLFEPLVNPFEALVDDVESGQDLLVFVTGNRFVLDVLLDPLGEILGGLLAPGLVHAVGETGRHGILNCDENRG